MSEILQHPCFFFALNCLLLKLMVWCRTKRGSAPTVHECEPNHIEDQQGSKDEGSLFAFIHFPLQKKGGKNQHNRSLGGGGERPGGGKIFGGGHDVTFQ